MRPVPLIGVPSDRKQIGPHPFQAVGEKYLRAIIDSGVGLPLMIPSMDPALDIDSVLAAFDGILLTGSPSNIEPRHYSDEPSYEGNLHDPERDLITLPLVRAAVERKIPVLAVCRGFQEVNVAFGGSLWQKVHEAPGFNDHREDKDQSLEVQYGLAHDLALTPGGLLAGIAGSDTVRVNSLHGQGIRRLGERLLVEATAPDGLIEAVRLDSDDSFLLAVQWHPEWRVLENPFYLGIFRAFAGAVHARAQSRN
ncbi:MAG: gamma-glutamyl-gamma-aminobutyrate hydrolase family protein [Lysobacterales bacterium]|nr:gamma-glutamyl-gamma-aminobutyrate hydrolase family protein [Xanthomonadales bacterium]MCB1611259.1 gamma-glutamyl-gamma-aminobutyrate hydrolase family protein [Xanthomonadales bacterium]MCP5474282.1 gamma-glutamyl-gamma-aminobutyrate hydrolase family protein [Rhodanobacteraceae bacterium]